jgi:hypothetical protein
MKPKLIIGVIAGVLVCGQAVAQTITVTKPTATDVWVKGEPATIQ